MLRHGPAWSSKRDDRKANPSFDKLVHVEYHSGAHSQYKRIKTGMAAGTSEHEHPTPYSMTIC
jgi:hypothetical protein